MRTRATDRILHSWCAPLGAALAALLPAGGAAAQSAPAALPGVIQASALIDGDSTLYIGPNGTYWVHHDKAGPGMHNFQTLPTQLSITAGGPTRTFAWCPIWANGCNTCDGSCGELREAMTSQPFPSVAIPGHVVSSSFSCTGRGTCTLVEAPTAANGYTAVIDFNDVPQPGPDTYTATLSFSYVPACDATACGETCHDGPAIPKSSGEIGVQSVGYGVACPVLGGSVEAKLSVSGTYETDHDATCASECKESSSVQGKGELEVSLCRKPAYTASFAAANARSRQYCKTCDQDSCATTCDAARSCDTSDMSIAGTLGVKEKYDLTFGGLTRVALVDATCSIEAAFDVGAKVHAIDVKNNGYTCGACAPCSAETMEVTTGAKLSGGCSIQLDFLGARPYRIGCEDCLELSLATQLGNESPTPSCDDPGCISGKVTAGAALKHTFCAPYLGYVAALEVSLGAEGECTSSSCSAGIECTPPNPQMDVKVTSGRDVPCN